jgi:DNA-binding MarR family transcriptional regulator
MNEHTFDRDGTMSSVHLLHRAGQCADDLFATGIGAAQLTPRQYTVLKCAAAVVGASQADLVDGTGIDRSTLADIVRRLVQRGYIERERTRRDARMYAVHVTETGRRVLAETASATEASEQTLLNAVAPSDREAFLRSLRSIITTFGPISSARVTNKNATRKVRQSDRPAQRVDIAPDRIGAIPRTQS